MLIGCVKIERFYICFSLGDLTDVGLGYVGKYGTNLRFLSLACIGESDEGLIKLSEGCPKLRKLEMNCCPFSKEAVASFVFNIQLLRHWDDVLVMLRKLWLMLVIPGRIAAMDKEEEKMKIKWDTS
ncbi:ACT domain-containing protein [Tanacetum coccineum]